jgi:hypothetical protein
MVKLFLRLFCVIKFIFETFPCIVVDYLEHHSKSIDELAITMDDCAHVFRKVPYDGKNEVVREKWRVIGQCLSRVCSKRCTWSDLEVRANAPNVCDYMTGAEEAVVYWLFVSEGKEWLIEFKRMNGHRNKNVDSDDTVATSTSQHKKSGQHKTMSFLKHWWQLKTIVKAHRQKRDISEKWDEAWKLFACEELELKKIREGVGKERSGMCCSHLKMCSALASRKVIILLDWRLTKIWTCLLCRLLMLRKI